MSGRLQFGAIPVELRSRPRWVVWRWEPDPEKPEKPRKPPYCASEPDRHASSTDSRTWATFEEALAVVESGNAAGLGFALGPPYVGVDLDEELSEADQGAVMLALDSYSERSPSGRGHHVIVRANMSGNGRHPEGIGVFQADRFFYCTGEHVQGTPTTIEERQAELDQVLEQFLPKSETVDAPPRAAQPVEADDEELLERARAARNGAAFERLWHGDTSGYASRSESDLALCSLLAFWTGPDPARIDRLFRRSGLMRPKWNREDYRAKTIDVALSGRREFYGASEREEHGFDSGVTPEFKPRVEDSEQDPALPFRGLSHDEVLELTFDGDRQLVEEIVEAGVLGVVAGIPETYKSWLAQSIAIGVARGEGEILGSKVIAQGAVGYFWQDDSRRNEAERIQTLERIRANLPGLPMRWFLNEGLELPRDLDRLRATIEQHELCLVVLDSFYNVATGDLKDRDAGQIVAALKKVCDATGCTILIVDHMPWATDTNRARLRTYGDVFKGAAARFGIYIDAERNTLYVEARGNNVRGFKRSKAYWDEGRLELRLVDTSAQEENEEELDRDVLEYVTGHPGRSLTKVRAGIRETSKWRNESIDASLERLKARGRVVDLARDGGAWSGQPGTPRYWHPANHAGSTPPELFGAGSGEDEAGASESATLPALPHPRRGGEVARGRVSEEAEP